MMRHPRTLERIVTSALCAGCGICKSIAEPGAIEMEIVEPGRMRPALRRELSARSLETILNVCPGINVDGRNRAEHDPTIPTDPVYGPTVSVTRGHASDDDVRFRAAAGGGLSALALYLVESGTVDFVLHVTASKDEPMRSKRHVSFDRAQVMDGAQSRYGPVAPLEDVVQLLDQNRRFAFIGKPCDVNALRNLARVDPRVDELVPYMMTFSCGAFPDELYYRRFLDRQKVRFEDLVRFRYRGHGFPGPIHARTRDGREVSETYLEFRTYPWTSQFRCKICPDHSGEQADITVMDDWPGGRPIRDERDGVVLVQARTWRGEELVLNAQRAGYLTLGPADIAAVYSTQPHQIARKRGAIARLMAIAFAGGLLPRFRAIRLARAAIGAGPWFHLQTFFSTFGRVLRGDNVEAAPAACRKE
jgi:coenzyme F420 hydrogenase subunit beta